jgi:tRNA(Arg) A34 adenosine deaminase TadA
MTKDKTCDKKYMKMAIKAAEKAGHRGEVPIGAVLVKGNKVLAIDHNRCLELNDPTAHAEVLVLRKGGNALKNYRLNNAVIYVTAEPCPMCTSAMVHGRISRLVFGTLEPKFGAVESKFRLLDGNGFNHKVDVQWGVFEEKCAEILRVFFKKKRLDKSFKVPRIEKLKA